MANGYTGEVRISTRLDNSKISKDSKAAAKEIERMSKEFDRVTDSIKKQSVALDAMKRDYDALMQGEKSPASLRAMETQLKKITSTIKEQSAAYSELADRLDKENLNLSISISESDMAGARLAEANIERLSAAAENLRAELNKNKEESRGLASNIEKIKLDPETSIEAKNLADKIGLAEENLQGSKDKANDLKDAINATYNQRLTGAESDIEKTNTAISRTGKESKKASPRIKKLEKDTKSAGRTAHNASRGFNLLSGRISKLVAGAFVFNVVRRGLSALQKNLSEVLKQNQQFSRSLNNIQVNLLSAFAPIWEAIQPALVTLIQLLERATATIAKFVAQLFGKTHQQAKQSAKGIYDQAKATDKAAESAKQAESAAKAMAQAQKDLARSTKKTTLALAGFDEINQLGITATDDYINTMLDGLDALNEAKDELNFGDPGLGYWGKLEDLLNSIRGILDKFFEPFKRAWEREGAATIEAWKRMLSSVWDLAKAIGNTFLEVWTDGHGEEFLVAILRLVQMVFHAVADIADAFLIAWTEGENGKKLVTALMEMFTNLLNLITSIGWAFREAWNDGTGVAIATNLLQIFTNLANIVSVFALKLQEAWLANDNGVLIWQAILGLVNDILDTINRMTESTVKWAESLNLEPLMGGVVKLTQSFRELAKVVLDYIGAAYEKVLLPLMKWLIEVFVPKALELLASIFKALASVLEALKPWAKWVWEDFLQPLAKWAGEKIINLIEKLTKAFTKFSDWARENQEIIQNVATLIIGFFAAMWTYNTVKNIVMFITQKLVPALQMLASVFNLNSIGVAALVIGITALVANWDKLTPAQQTITLLGALAAALITAALAVGVFHTTWSAGLAAAAIVAGLAMLGSVKYFVGKNVPNVTSGGSSGGGPRSATNLKMPNVATNMMNTIKKGSPLPELAEGAVLYPNQPFAAIVGDQRRGVNVETPLAVIDEVVSNRVNEAVSRLNSSGDAVMELDGTVFARLIKPYADKENIRVGVKMSSN